MGRANNQTGLMDRRGSMPHKRDKESQLHVPLLEHWPRELPDQFQRVLMEQLQERVQ